jgi:hypothetical protein
MMTFPIYGKIKNVPNHQPVLESSKLALGWLIFHTGWHWIFHTRIELGSCSSTKAGGVRLHLLNIWLA